MVPPNRPLRSANRISLVPHRHKTVKLSRPLMDTAAATLWNDLPDSIETVIAPIFTMKILFENQQNSTHKKKRYIHKYTEEKTTTYDMPSTNSLPFIIYIEYLLCIIYLS